MGPPSTHSHAGPPAHSGAGAPARERGLARSLVVAAVLCAVAGLGPAAQEPGFDLLVRNARIVDGTGNPWFCGDVAVRGGRIARVGLLNEVPAREVVDAAGRVVIPGFIDLHSHADRGLVRRELRFNQAFLYQGVTTSVLGVDGGGGDDVEAASRPMLAYGLGTNIAWYVGHNAARRQAMGIANREPSAAELDAMKAFVERGMRSGTFGISTGLAYIPGRYATTAEVIELSRVAARFGGIYDTHYRDEFFNLLDSIREGILIAERAAIPVHFGHFKVIGQHNWGVLPQAIALIDRARARGLQITADQYPWDNGAVSLLHEHLQIPRELTALFTLWRKAADAPPDERTAARQAYLEALRRALEGPAARAAIRRATERGLDGPEFNNWIAHWGYDWFRVVRTKRHPEYLDQTISEIAYWKATSGFDIVADLIVEEGDDLGVSIGPMSTSDVEAAMVKPWVAHSTDGTLAPPGEGFPHPRAAGSYARLIEHYVVERGLLSLEEAVRKSTSLPAQILGLRDRGQIREGFHADLIVFDPKRVRNRATYVDPHPYAEGFDLVVVNGRTVLKDGAITGETPGLVLRHRLAPLGPGPATGRTTARP